MVESAACAVRLGDPQRRSGGRRRRARPLRGILLAGSLLAVVGVAAGCGSSDDSSGGSSSSGDSGSSAPTLTIAYPGNNPSTMLSYIADAKGYFKGVEVNIKDGLGANTASLVSSGQADIAMYAVATPLTTAAQGKATSVIFELAGGGNGGGMLASKDVTSVAQLQAKKSCRIATFPPGSSAYGFAVLYKERLHLECDLVPLADGPSQLAALTAGRADAIVGSLPNFTAAVSAGKAKVLVDTRDPAARDQYLGKPYTELVEWGLTDNLKKKKAAVTAYVAGLRQAAKFVAGAKDADIATLLHPFPAFKTLTMDVLTQNVSYSRPYLMVGSDQGRIAQAQWDDTLQQLKTWGIPSYDPGNSAYAYGQRVDMSYYDAAGTAGQ